MKSLLLEEKGNYGKLTMVGRALQLTRTGASRLAIDRVMSATVLKHYQY